MKYGRRIRRMTKRGRDSDDHMEEIVRATTAKRDASDPELGLAEEKDDDVNDMVPPARAASPTCPGIAPVRCNTRDERSAQMIVP